MRNIFIRPLFCRECGSVLDPSEIERFKHSSTTGKKKTKVVARYMTCHAVSSFHTQYRKLGFMWLTEGNMLFSLLPWIH